MDEQKLLNNLNVRNLWFFTAIIAAAGLVAYSDDDLGAFFLIICGFAYSSALYFSLKIKPDAKRFLSGTSILGVSNLLVFYSSILVLVFPPKIASYLVYLVPNLAGAAITLFVLGRIWSTEISKAFVLRSLIFVAIASFVSKPVLNAFSEDATVKGLSFSLNSVLWCIAFSLSISTQQRGAN